MNESTEAFYQAGYDKEKEKNYPKMQRRMF